MIFGHLNKLQDDYWYLPTRTDIRLFYMGGNTNSETLVERWQLVCSNKPEWGEWHFVCDCIHTRISEHLSIKGNFREVMDVWEKLIDKQLRFEFSPNAKEFKNYKELKDGGEYGI